MKIYTGELLQRHLDDNDMSYGSLSVKTRLDKYIHSDSRRIMCIYGLRMTGKTTMMEQEMRNINDVETIAKQNGMSQNELIEGLIQQLKLNMK